MYVGLAVENKNMLKLSQRMVNCYGRNLIPCKENPWVPLPISDDDKEIFVRMNTNLDDVGLPRGVTITIYTSVLLPIPQITLFEFLRNGSNRSKVIPPNISSDLLLLISLLDHQKL